jgi:hypothetical protein
MSIPHTPCPTPHCHEQIWISTSWAPCRPSQLLTLGRAPANRYKKKYTPAQTCRRATASSGPYSGSNGSIFFHNRAHTGAQRPHLPLNGRQHHHAAWTAPLSHDTVQKWTDGATMGAGILGCFSTPWFWHGGTQYQFMFTPAGQWWMPATPECSPTPARAYHLSVSSASRLLFGHLFNIIFHRHHHLSHNPPNPSTLDTQILSTAMSKLLACAPASSPIYSHALSTPLHPRTRK